MENTNGVSEVDPAVDLALLKSTQGSVDMHQGLHPGPWWLAPIAAAFLVPVGSPETFCETQARTVGALTAMLVLLGLLIWYAVTLGPVPGKPSVAALAWACLVAIPLVLALLVGWVAAPELVGRDNFFPVWSFVGWLLTMLILLGVRSACLTFLSRRTLLS